MSRFSTRVVVLFALVATFPVALTGIVWLAVSQWGADSAGPARRRWPARGSVSSMHNARPR